MDVGSNEGCNGYSMLIILEVGNTAPERTVTFLPLQYHSVAYELLFEAYRRTIGGKHNWGKTSLSNGRRNSGSRK